MKSDEISVSIVTAFFLVYISFMAFEIYTSIAIAIFIISPALVIFMVYSVLKHGKYNGHNLKKGQEFGYLDRPNLGKPNLRNANDEVQFDN